MNAFKVNNNNRIQWQKKICLEIPFSKKSYHIEISQLIWETLQLTGFYMMRVFSESWFRMDFKTAFAFKI